MIHQRPPLFTNIVALCAGLSIGGAMSAPATARQIPIDTVPSLFADDGSAYPCAHRDAAARAAAGGASVTMADWRYERQRQHRGRAATFVVLGALHL